MLTLTFLGVGSAFAKRNYQSNALVELWSQPPGIAKVPLETLLIDFGTTGPRSLHTLKSLPSHAYLDADGGADYRAIDRVFVTHLHADHVGGLEELSFLNQYKFIDAHTGDPHRPELISTAKILKDLWSHTLQGGLSAQVGRMVTIENYFRLMPVLVDTASVAFTMGERYQFRVFPTDHIRIQTKYDWPSCGLMISDKHTNRSIMYSGDTRFDEDGLGSFMQEADLIFHDCQLVDSPITVHARISELRTLNESIRKKMMLYHYEDVWDLPEFQDIEKDFDGLVKPHHRYVLFGGDGES